jgi:hypothetical protein
VFHPSSCGYQALPAVRQTGGLRCPLSQIIQPPLVSEPLSSSSRLRSTGPTEATLPMPPLNAEAFRSDNEPASLVGADPRASGNRRARRRADGAPSEQELSFWSSPLQRCSDGGCFDRRGVRQRWRRAGLLHTRCHRSRIERPHAERLHRSTFELASRNRNQRASLRRLVARYHPMAVSRHHRVDCMRARGLEPPRPKPPAPKAGASTNSATPARA